MELMVENVGDVAVVAVPGPHLDASNAREFSRDIGPVLEANRKVILDVSKVEFVDSSGLGAFLSCLRRLNAGGGDLKMCGLAKPVRVIFELVRFHRIIGIYNKKEEAVRAFEK